MNSVAGIGWENTGKSYFSALSCSSAEVAARQSLRVIRLRTLIPSGS
jgi:hypothetical protein